MDDSGLERLINYPENTEVYNLVCESIGIKALPNNGTLHLPLKPIGLHSDFKDGSSDAVSSSESHSASLTALNEESIISSHRISDSVENTEQSATPSTESPDADPDHAGDGASGKGDDKGDKGDENKDSGKNEGSESENAHSWLSWFNETFKKVKDWVKNKVHGSKEDEDD